MSRLLQVYITCSQDEIIFSPYKIKPFWTSFFCVPGGSIFLSLIWTSLNLITRKTWIQFQIFIKLLFSKLWHNKEMSTFSYNEVMLERQKTEKETTRLGAVWIFREIFYPTFTLFILTHLVFFFLQPSTNISSEVN